VNTTNEQKALALRFLDSVQRRNGSEIPVLQDLLYSIFTQRLTNRTAHAFPAYRFLVLYSFRRDGSVQPCNDITQIISKIVFFARGCIYRQIKSIMDKEDRGFFE